MKKIGSVLIAICMMAQLVSAGYVQIRAAGNSSDTIYASTGETIAIEISLSGFSDEVLESLALMTFNVKSSKYDGAGYGTASNNAIIGSLFDEYSESGTLTNSRIAIISGVYGIRSEDQVYNNPEWAVEETVVYTFDYTTGMTNGYTVISLVNAFFQNFNEGDIPTNISNLTVTVPEPITMALLGVGGLFIRKRR